MRSLILVLFLALPAFGDTVVTDSLDMPVDLDLTVSVEGCSNHPGPTITVDGVMVSGGFNGELVARNAGGKHEGTLPVSAEFSLVPVVEQHVWAKQPSRGGVTGNPKLYFRILDEEGNTVKEIYLGRCNKL